MTAAAVAAAVPDWTPGKRRRHVHGERLLEEVRSALIYVQLVQDMIDQDRTAAAVVRYVEGAVADLDDARVLLEHHLKGVG